MSASDRPQPKPNTALAPQMISRDDLRNIIREYCNLDFVRWEGQSLADRGFNLIDEMPEDLKQVDDETNLELRVPNTRMLLQWIGVNMKTQIEDLKAELKQLEINQALVISQTVRELHEKVISVDWKVTDKSAAAYADTTPRAILFNEAIAKKQKELREKVGEAELIKVAIEALAMYHRGYEMHLTKRNQDMYYSQLPRPRGRPSNVAAPMRNVSSQPEETEDDPYADYK